MFDTPALELYKNTWHGYCVYQQRKVASGTRFLFFSYGFSGPLSSSWLDLIYWQTLGLCNHALWNTLWTKHTLLTIGTDSSTRLNSHLDAFRSLKFEITATQRKKKSHTVQFWLSDNEAKHFALSTHQNWELWPQASPINRVLWSSGWTCGNRWGIVLPGLSVSGLWPLGMAKEREVPPTNTQTHIQNLTHSDLHASTSRMLQSPTQCKINTHWHRSEKRNYTYSL